MSDLDPRREAHLPARATTGVFTTPFSTFLHAFIFAYYGFYLRLVPVEEGTVYAAATHLMTFGSQALAIVFALVGLLALARLPGTDWVHLVASAIAGGVLAFVGATWTLSQDFSGLLILVWAAIHFANTLGSWRFLRAKSALANSDHASGDS